MIQRTERLAQLLQDAMLIAEQSRDRALLRHLRGARISLHDFTQPDIPVRVDLLSGRIFSRGLPVPLSRSELSVMIAISLHERGVSREMLAEDLYPGADVLAASNILKVNVHRVRRRLGAADVIRYSGGRYALGDTVDVELPRLEAELRRLVVDETLSNERCDRLENLRQRILDGRSAFVLEWAWFEDVERRLRDLGHEITLVLARDALRKEYYERAIELATELVHDDPLDEIAAEIAIRAFLFAGNRTAAALEYRRYASALRREIDSSPSEGLRSLVRDHALSDQRVQP